MRLLFQLIIHLQLTVVNFEIEIIIIFLMFRNSQFYINIKDISLGKVFFASDVAK